MSDSSMNYGGCTETKDTRNSSMTGTPAPEALDPKIIQQPQPISVFPAVKG
jgi:hypothetical protein